MKLVIQNTSHVWGGNEKWLALLAEGLIARGHEVIVSCAMGAVHAELASRGIPTSPFRPRGAIDFVSGLAFAAWLRAQRADTLLLTSWRPTVWAIAAAKLSRIGRVVMRLGIVRPFPRATPKALALRAVDAVIVNSVEIRDTWKRTAPDADERVHVVLNAVKLRIDERPALVRALRNDLGLADTTLLFGGAGHLAPRKGFDLLLRAFAAAGIQDSLLAIIGDGPHRESLRQLAAELGLNDRMRWLGHRDDGAGVIGGLDAFVLSSHNEGMANVMLEAMAAGTPVIAADISGVRRAIAPADGRSEAGWIVPGGDVRELSATMVAVARELRERSSEVERRTSEAAWRAGNWFSEERMVREAESILFPVT
jgi:glycosyltransferase involved in cell wall biosynthesis